MTGGPLFHKAEPSQTGKKVHIHQHRQADNGDGRRRDIAIGLFESDNDKRQHQEGR
jgi:hypothetical protein